MKKKIQTAILLSAGIICMAAPVFADGLVFDPESYSSKTAQGTYASAPATTTKTVNTAKVKDITNSSVRENTNLQNALFELDSAQVDVRNQLIEEKAKFTDIDNQYKLVKEQRKQQKKAVRESERRIKQIEKTKKQVRNSMKLSQ